MDKSALKKYAPRARQEFIAAVTRRAETLGLNPDNPGTVEHNGDAMLINGQPFPAALKRQRDTLQERIAEHGFGAVMDATAYTWFNRLVAIRYMELHDFLGHGYRVLSHPQGHAQPEILDHVADLDMPGLDRQHALELKLAGNRDEELYREVLLAQCHALHTGMPFLFESIDDATELLLPDGLLRTDSLIRELVTAIDEASWQEVEIIGWLYQFYISEKKSQVIGKVVKSEDIPAATQLFTPNWIVKYLVQNSLGRLWLMANPSSTLASQWDYYIQPAEQTPEVNAQLDELIQTRIEEDGNTLNPESLTLLDPACGSGHILVEAYDLLRDIYLERGYRRRDIPRLILEKNLYGLDIDDRAAQLARFALLMKARTDDRRLFGQPLELNVLALHQPKEGSAAGLYSALNVSQIAPEWVNQLVGLFDQVKIFGSLIHVPQELASKLPELRKELGAAHGGGDLLGRDAAKTLLRLVVQAEVLEKQFDAVVANPPYMTGKFHSSELKGFISSSYPEYTHDIFSAFIVRALSLSKPNGFLGFMAPYVWMFISAHGEFRNRILDDTTLESLIQLEYSGFEEATVPICTFCMARNALPEYESTFIRLSDFRGAEKQAPKTREAISNPSSDWLYRFKLSKLTAIPGRPIAYWATDAEIEAFSHTPLSELSKPLKGFDTGSNAAKYFRKWWEVDEYGICFDRNNLQNCSWVPVEKGGAFRKWYGNKENVVWFKNSGEGLYSIPKANIRNKKSYFKKGYTYTVVSSGATAFRETDGHSIFYQSAGTGVCKSDDDRRALLGFLNSKVAKKFLELLCPTLNYTVNDVAKLPVKLCSATAGSVEELVSLAKTEWDLFETSSGFPRLRLVSHSLEESTIQACFKEFSEGYDDICNRVRFLEDEVDNLYSKTYGTTQEGEPVRREDFRVQAASEVARLLSYSIACMMGRYSLDAPGLIYAHAANEGFDPSQYKTFPADADGIVPITDEAWFGDDGANRIREFVRVVWGEDTVAENMSWLAESLGTQRGESADDTIRRYISKQFYKDHLQTYKKRPIYWLFSSGKHKAFEALVYLHRYNAGTLSRMRMEYVVPLQSRMQSRIDSLEQDMPAAASSAETKRLQKQRDKLVKQLDELRQFDESLRHYADQRITLDLDDGVKVNYGKFGNLLDEVKTVTGVKA